MRFGRDLAGGALQHALEANFEILRLTDAVHDVPAGLLLDLEEDRHEFYQVLQLLYFLVVQVVLDKLVEIRRYLLAREPVEQRVNMEPDSASEAEYEREVLRIVLWAVHKSGGYIGGGGEVLLEEAEESVHELHVFLDVAQRVCHVAETVEERLLRLEPAYTMRVNDPPEQDLVVAAPFQRPIQKR